MPGPCLARKGHPTRRCWGGPRLPVRGMVGAWIPPVFLDDATDPTRIFIADTGVNGVWDADTGQWIITATGAPIGYDQ